MVSLAEVQNPLQTAFWYASIVLQGLLLAKLLHTGLAKRYGVLSAYLGFGVLRGIVLICLEATQVRVFGLTAYNLAYVIAQPVVWIFFFLLILELFSRMVEEFPGIRRLSRWTMFAALGITAAAGCVLMVVEQEGGFDPYPFLSHLALQGRSVFLALSSVLLAVLLFVGYYRIPIPRNVWTLCASFGGYFVSSAVLLSLRWYFGETFKSNSNLFNSVFFFLALLGPLLFLAEAGEKVSYPISMLWGSRNPELEAALALQLRGLNQALVKVLKQ